MLNNASRKASCFVFLLVGLMLAASAASAQVAQPDNNVEQAAQITSAVTASATAERVRFTSPNTVVQLRLEVYDEAGQKLLDTEQRGGNVLDWHLQGGAGERVADGVYLCVLTSKNLAGRISQKLGQVTVSGQATVVRSAAVAELNLRQAQTVGPIESGETGLTVMGAEDAPPVTVLANNGDDAQLARTRGALTFRVGDFFSGNDKEQMRLTEEGNLGIGTSEPRAKLDVAGTIRAERVLIAKPKATNNQKAQAGDTAQTTDTDTAQPLTSGSGTQGRIAKWLDNAGTLGDTSVSESNGAVVIGTAQQSGNLQIFGPATADVFAGMGPDLINGPAFNYGYAGNSFGRSAGFFNVRPDSSAIAPNPSLRFATANVQRMIIDNNGNVGIGTTAPVSLLHVRGASPVRILGDTTTLAGNEYVDFFARSSIFSSDLGGMRIQRQSSTGNIDTLLFAATSGSSATEMMRITGDGDVGIGTTSPQAKLDVNGTLNVSNRGTFAGVSIGGGPIPGNTTLFVNGFVNLAVLGLPATTHVCIQNTGYLAQCASAAEYVPTRDAGKGFPETADLVSIAPKVANPYGDTHGPFTVQKSAISCDADLLGFIVNPESGADGKKVNEHYLPLAIYGYFPAKVTLENGAIKRGDPITSSSKPGYGMKATQACKIVGYALEDANKEGTIQVFAHQSEYTAPQVANLQAQVTALHRENAAVQKENANRQRDNLAAQSEKGRLQARLNRLERAVGVLQLASAQKHKQRRIARVRLVTRTSGRSGAGARKLAALR